MHLIIIIINITESGDDGPSCLRCYHQFNTAQQLSSFFFFFYQAEMGEKATPPVQGCHFNIKPENGKVKSLNGKMNQRRGWI